MVTRIARTTSDGVVIKGKDLVDDLIGERSFTEVLYFLVADRFPDHAEARILDACLVTLMEHGWNPSTIIARFMADSVPEEIQVAMASGLLAIGSVFAGTAEDCARLLKGALDQDDALDAFFRKTIAAHRSGKTPIPGFGHPVHKPEDPRAIKLMALARQLRPESRPLAALSVLSSEVDKAFGKHITINATGAIAALLLEIGIVPEIMRGMAVVSRAGGLIGHIVEERETHSSRDIWRLAEEHFPYED